MKEYNRVMATRKNNEKPLTLRELAKYNQEVLFPFMKENFATKKDMENLIDIVATKDQLGGFEKDVKYIKENLDEASKLGHRVEYIENVLNLPVKKN